MARFVTFQGQRYLEIPMRAIDKLDEILARWKRGGPPPVYEMRHGKDHPSALTAGDRHREAPPPRGTPKMKHESTTAAARGLFS